MVTTAIALVAGIALLVIGSTQRRFDRLFSAVTQPRTVGPSNPPAKTPSERVFLRVCRMLTLGVGGVCVALGALGIWSRV